jgi:signal transduction histidine kinase/CheY-like chemotaxis protein
MSSRWRLFRGDGGAAAGPPPIAYGLLFVVSLAMSHWAVARYGAAVIWTANGVLLAGVLQLKRRDAIRLLIVCAALNLVGNMLRHDTPRMLLVNVGLNVGEVLMAGTITRRVCGAALDLRRPARLFRFALLAVVPTTLLSAAIGVAALQAPVDRLWINFETWFSVEAIGMLAVTPPLLLWAQGRRFVDEQSGQRPWEPAALMGLLAAVTVAVFAQRIVPAPFLVFPPLLLIAFRLSPRWSAASVMLVALIAAAFTLNGVGPMLLGSLAPKMWFRADVAPVLGALPIYNLFMAAVLAVSLPASTILTERRRLEARLRHRTALAVAARRAAEEASAAKARFLSMMSHEMRTPLNGVAGFAQLLALRQDMHPDAIRQVQGVKTSSDRLLTLVDEILEFASGDLRITCAAFSPADLLRRAVEETTPDAEAKRLSFTACCEGDETGFYLGDARRIAQVLRHLLSNAVKFTTVGGIEIRLTCHDDQIAFNVSDTGPGLPDDLLGRPYEMFAQADSSISRAHEGAGVGLALSQRLAAAMGGGLVGANRPGGGAQFTVSLPLARAEPAGAAVQAEPAELCAPRILVVDDHQTNREVAKLLLEALGCEVTLACDGWESVEAVTTLPLDFVLMDVRMPNMDGLEATRRIRALAGPQAQLPIVAMTADAMPDDVACCLAAGMNVHHGQTNQHRDAMQRA